MWDQGASPGARRRSNFKSGHPRLNSTSLDEELVFNNADLSLNPNNLSHQFISHGLSEGFIEFEIIRANISTWQRDIDKEPITFEGIKTEYDELKGIIHSLYQDALYAQVTDKLSYYIISLIALIDRVKRAADRYIRNEN